MKLPVCMHTWHGYNVEDADHNIVCSCSGRAEAEAVVAALNAVHNGKAALARRGRGMPVATPPKFPTMLRKMWSGGEVQEWINSNWYAREPVYDKSVVKRLAVQMGLIAEQ